MAAPLTETDVRRLYARYITARDIEASERMQSELRALLDGTAGSTATASAAATELRGSVQSHRNRLQESSDIVVVRSVAADVVAEADRMIAVTGELSSALAMRSRELQELSERLEQAQSDALLDPLTGLRNRRGFERAIAQLEEQGTGLSGAALVVADIDHFKQVNDTHGHVLGDKVIRAVAHVLRSNIKGRDVAVRLGGEEFAVLLPDTSVSGAASLAEKIRTLVARSRIRRNDGNEFVGHVTLSLGVAAAEYGDTLKSLIERADQALYAAKRAGRNRVSVAAAERRA